MPGLLDLATELWQRDVLADLGDGVDRSPALPRRPGGSSPRRARLPGQRTDTDVYKLTYARDRSGIIVMAAQELNTKLTGDVTIRQDEVRAPASDRRRWRSCRSVAVAGCPNGVGQGAGMFRVSLQWSNGPAG